MKTERRTKIVCTIGPACREPKVLARLIEAGMDVARLNMSHGTQDQHAQVFADIRRLAEAKGRPVAILQDLSGSKIRLGALREPLDLRIGDEIELTTEMMIGEGSRIPVNYSGLTEDLNPGDSFSMADGLIALHAIDRSHNSIRARVLSGGRISSHKGVNIPKGGTSLPPLTEKDAEDLRFGVRLGVDWVALSFVRSHFNADIPRSIMDEAGRRVPLMAKIEKQQAIEDIDAILDSFDGIMVARGDLGIETELEDVPRIQKELIRRANCKAKPAITATQMLLSMTQSPRPTRAEVTDVANAILDGTDAVMLSEETAAGQYPVESVEMLARIALRAEMISPQTINWSKPASSDLSIPRGIAEATYLLAGSVGARMIITPTTGGTTPQMVAATRPRIPILALSANPETVRALCMTWGVQPMLITEPIHSSDQLYTVGRRVALESGLVKPGDRVVITAGVPINVPGTTNLVEVREI